MHGDDFVSNEVGTERHVSVGCKRQRVDLLKGLPRGDRCGNVDVPLLGARESLSRPDAVVAALGNLEPAKRSSIDPVTSAWSSSART